MSDPSPVVPVFLADFHGAPLNVLSLDGRPCWLAREVGAAIGYANGGKRLVSLVTNEWADEFIEGHDFCFVRGEDLSALKASDAVRAQAPSALLLFEPGLHLVLTKTSKPVGRALRRYLVDEVLPRLARRAPTVGVSKPWPAEALSLSDLLPWLREARLRRRLRLDERRHRSVTLRRYCQILHSAGRIDDEERVDWELYACEAAVGEDLPILAPAS